MHLYPPFVTNPMERPKAARLSIGAMTILPWIGRFAALRPQWQEMKFSRYRDLRPLAYYFTQDHS